MLKSWQFQRVGHALHSTVTVLHLTGIYYMQQLYTDPFKTWIPLATSTNSVNCTLMPRDNPNTWAWDTQPQPALCPEISALDLHQWWWQLWPISLWLAILINVWHTSVGVQRCRYLSSKTDIFILITVVCCSPTSSSCPQCLWDEQFHRATRSAPAEG